MRMVLNINKLEKYFGKVPPNGHLYKTPLQGLSMTKLAIFCDFIFAHEAKIKCLCRFKSPNSNYVLYCK